MTQWCAICVCEWCVTLNWVVRGDQKITFELLLNIKESVMEKSGVRAFQALRLLNRI